MLAKDFADVIRQLDKKIAASNEDPSEYIETSYTVSEDAYKNWPSSLKDQFTQFRIVTPQKASVHVVEK